MKCPFCGAQLVYDDYDWCDDNIVVFLICKNCNATIHYTLPFDKVLKIILRELLNIEVEE